MNSLLHKFSNLGMRKMQAEEGRTERSAKGNTARAGIQTAHEIDFPRCHFSSVIIIKRREENDETCRT